MTTSDQDAPPRPALLDRERLLLPLGVIGGAVLIMAALVARAPAQFGLLLPFVGVAIVAVVLSLTSPLVAAVYLLTATFFRLAVPTGLFPYDPFLLTFAGVVLSVGIWLRSHRAHLPSVGLLEVFIGLYVAWNVGSMLAPHTYPPIYPQDGSSISVSRFIFIGTVMPMAMLLLGRTAFGRGRDLRVICFCLMGFAAYSAFVSIMQFHGPASLVWPRYALNNPEWPDRAVGVVNQPVVNGLVLILGYLAALLVASHRVERTRVRVLAGIVAMASCYSIYLTHTRAVWLALVLVVVLGLLLARGWRIGFAITAGITLLAVVVNWATFTSSDRQAGGVESTNELYDRLNIIATSLWAVREKPFAGWGVGRFAAVNTYHHQQWSPSIPWNRGYGLASHLDVLGIAAELGLVGLILWLSIMTVVVVRLFRALNFLSPESQYGQPFAVFALLSLVCLFGTGLTVDLRFFVYPNIVVLLLVGAAIGRAEAATRLSVEAMA